MHDEISMEAWLFLNHLSLMMEYDVLSQIYINGKEKSVSFEDLRQVEGCESSWWKMDNGCQKEEDRRDC